MGSIYVLDCTLRDGGYINDWRFGREAIREIGQRIVRSGVEYFEAGFIRDTPYDPDLCIYPSNREAASVFAPKSKQTRYFGMVDMKHPAPIENLGMRTEDGFDGIRVIFKKDKRSEGYEYCKKLIGLGYIVTAQLVSTHTYSDEELTDTVKRFSELDLRAISIVDTLGLIKRRQFLHMVGIMDEIMPQEMALGYHSHNNLQQAMGNATALIEENLRRDVIIDACVFGMGRGAGNLNMELFMEYLNEGYGKQYRVEPLLEIIDAYLNDIYMHRFWGYSLPYYLSAVNGCHPNYAKYFAEKGTLTEKAFGEILKRIPVEQKENYVPETAENCYREFQADFYDDKHDIEQLRKIFEGKQVLLVGAGATIATHQKQIKEWQKTNKGAVTVSLNYIPEAIEPDYVFSCHMRRYSKIYHQNRIPKIITSNIRDAQNYDYKINFSSFADPDPVIMDNSGIMCLNLLVELGVSQVALAGMDGYDEKQNYINSSMEFEFSKQLREDRNRLLRSGISRLKNSLPISFLTPSMYEERQ